MTTNLHYAANGNFSGSTYLPGACGFNLADVGSASQLNVLPAGVKGLVYLNGASGATSAFKSAVDSCAGNAKLFGFYLADEPASTADVAANLKAASDYVHNKIPTAKTFMVLENLSSNESPSYYNLFNPAGTHIDLFGIDPYPVQDNVNGGYDLGIIGKAINAAVANGVPKAQLIPTFQAFGGGGWVTYHLPTAAQEQALLAEWDRLLPTPVFEYAYSWGVQENDQAIVNVPYLQAIFTARNSGGVVVVPPGGTDFTISIAILAPGLNLSASSVVLSAKNAHSGVGTFREVGGLVNGTLVLSGPDAAKFTLDNGGVLPCALRVGATALPAGSYSITGKVS